MTAQSIFRSSDVLGRVLEYDSDSIDRSPESDDMQTDWESDHGNAPSVSRSCDLFGRLEDLQNQSDSSDSSSYTESDGTEWESDHGSLDDCWFGENSPCYQAGENNQRSEQLQPNPYVKLKRCDYLIDDTGILILGKSVKTKVADDFSQGCPKRKSPVTIPFVTFESLDGMTSNSCVFNGEKSEEENSDPGPPDLKPIFDVELVKIDKNSTDPYLRMSSSDDDTPPKLERYDGGISSECLLYRTNKTERSSDSDKQHYPVNSARKLTNKQHEMYTAEKGSKPVRKRIPPKRLDPSYFLLCDKKWGIKMEAYKTLQKPETVKKQSSRKKLGKNNKSCSSSVNVASIPSVGVDKQDSERCVQDNGVASKKTNIQNPRINLSNINTNRFAALPANISSDRTSNSFMHLEPFQTERSESYRRFIICTDSDGKLFSAEIKKEDCNLSDPGRVEEFRYPVEDASPLEAKQSDSDDIDVEHDLGVPDIFATLLTVNHDHDYCFSSNRAPVTSRDTSKLVNLHDYSACVESGKTDNASRESFRTTTSETANKKKKKRQCVGNLNHVRDEKQRRKEMKALYQDLMKQVPRLMTTPPGSVSKLQILKQAIGCIRDLRKKHTFQLHQLQILYQMNCTLKTRLRSLQEDAQQKISVS